eukprot:scaffold71229_cov29-Prasinocladus_malaysianus.AAC.1
MASHSAFLISVNEMNSCVLFYVKSRAAAYPISAAAHRTYCLPKDFWANATVRQHGSEAVVHEGRRQHYLGNSPL